MLRQQIVNFVHQSCVWGNPLAGTNGESLSIHGKSTAGEVAVNYERNKPIDGSEKHDTCGHTIHAPSIGVVHVSFVLPDNLK